MVKYDAFKSILRMTQKELKDFCKKMLEYYEYEIEEKDGYLFGKGDIPIMLVAHLDTIHNEKPNDIYFDSEQGVMWSPQGIGGDDRCGVYMILKILKDYKPYIAFLEDEEIGCVGARKMAKGLEKPNVKFIIELDRRGRDDCVFYDCGNNDFQEYIKSFGFQKQNGTFSDICDLSPIWNIASTNLSVGYKKEHTTSETINVNYMLETFQKVAKILDDKESKYYDYQEEKRYYQYSTINNSDVKEENKETKKASELPKPKAKKWHKGNYYDEYGYIDDDGFYVEWDDLKDVYY